MTEDKLNKGQIQLNVREHYRPLELPMVEETGKQVLNLINKLNLEKFIDEMTKNGSVKHQVRLEYRFSTP